MCHIILPQQLELQLMETVSLEVCHLHVITGSQEFHQELRLLITTYMIHKSVFSPCMVSSYGSMEQYMKQSRMQSLGVWATEVEITAAVSLF